MTPSVIFTLASTEDGEFITVYAPGRDPLPADSSHANFETIKALCLDASQGEYVDADEVVDLFDIGETVERKFERLTERVAVSNGQITLDGDPVHGSLQEQILDFLNKGEDFGPLVNFYEKLSTNPLGNVQDGLFDWIVGQRESGTFTITPDGDVIGYKSVNVSSPEWREGDGLVYVPSRRGEGTVNGIAVSADQYIEQRDGDVVEMPRSRVLNEPSVACGDGLHIGTYGYASTFLGSDSTVLLVKFSPRDIVSLPDSNSSWKLRVCRYTVIGVADEALDTPLYITEAVLPEVAEQAAEQGIDLDVAITMEDFILRTDQIAVDLADSLDLDLVVGDRVVDEDGDVATVTQAEDEDGEVLVSYDDEEFGDDYIPVEDLERASADESNASARKHGKGGPTSQAAKGRGLNPAQNPTTGRFEQGRPGSRRSGTSGRFTA